MPVPVDTLKTCPLFAGFTDTGLAILAEIARPRDVPQGMSVFLAGTGGDGLLIVLSGTVEILIGQGAQARLLCVLKEGAHFGELALLKPSKRAVTARARTPLKLAEIRRNDFNGKLQEKPQACLKLMLNIFNVVGERLDAVRDDIVKLA